ncbi:MAG: hypothetical protein JWQ38_550 [Flavipsychrobacter sp.]|nr:hypothetical protein [Flavipsychrobacter sp.]
MNAYFRVGILFCLCLGLQLCVLQSRASFFVKKRPVAVCPGKGGIHSSAAISRMLHASADVAFKDDEAKSVLSVVAGCAGILSLIAAVAFAAPVLVVPAVAFGVIGIILGATGKDAYRTLGYVGLGLSAAVIVVSLIIVIDALVLTTAVF